ncbi:MAG: O-acetylhomoserine aminocarboxypropyltransferase/cysteine synthase family protein [Planctomycetota bacterium]
MTHEYGLATKALHAGYEPPAPSYPAAVPVYATTSYVFEDTQHAADLFALRRFGDIYSRLGNPTLDVLEKRLAAMDGGQAGVALASGMAAIHATVMTLARAGENFITSRSLYGGTWTLFTQTLPRQGIEARAFDPLEPDRIERLADENTRFVYLETIGNPKNDVPDFEQVAEAAHELGLPVVVDNTVATPVLFRPLTHGADIVVYSATKFIGGHGAHIGGAVVDGGKFHWEAAPDRWAQFCRPDPAYHGAVFTDAVRDVGNIAFAAHLRTHWLRDAGACMSPYAAQLFLLGLETLHLRMPRHCANARTIAEWLAEHPNVEWVNYPGLDDHPCRENVRTYLPDGAGAIVGFGIRGGREAGERFINNVRLARHLANIGDAKTLVIHPSSTTHQQLSEDEQRAAGVSPEYVRLSVGIEDVADIRADLDQALRAAGEQPA